MANQYIGEVRLVGFNFAPQSWAICAGQTQSIADNSALFNLIGTTYGGDGQNTFLLPNLQGRIPLHQGSNGVSNYVIGQAGGTESVTISANQYPLHNHALFASNGQSASNSPGGNVLGQLVNAYSAASPTIAMNSAVLGAAQGGSQPHDNRQPYLVLNWVIALYGVYPSQN